MALPDDGAFGDARPAALRLGATPHVLRQRLQGYLPCERRQEMVLALPQSEETRLPRRRATQTKCAQATRLISGWGGSSRLR